jgi:hypothetical protein
MDANMTFEQIQNALVLMHKPVSDFEKSLVKLNEDFCVDLLNMIRYYMAHNNKKTMKSSQVTNMWLFLLEGHRVRHLFSTLTLNQLGALIDCTKTFKDYEEDILNLNTDDVLKLGPFIFDSLKAVKIIDFKFRMAQKRYNDVFSKSSDPLVWLKIVNYDVDNFLKDVPQEIFMKKLFEICYLFNRPEFDPVLQPGSHPQC